MKWLSRKFGVAVFGAAITLISGSAQSAMGQSARPLVPIPGPLLTVQTNMTSFFALAMDPATGRTFVSHPDDNKITIYGPTGLPTGTVISGVLKPTDVLAVNGVVYALLEGSGQIIRIDPVTQLVSVVASGLPTPRGLGFTDGKLWTVMTTGPIWWDRALISIDPVTAAQQVFSFTARGSAPEFERISTSPFHPGVLFGSYGPGVSPTGLNRLVLSSAQYVHLHDTVGETGSQVSSDPVYPSVAPTNPTPSKSETQNITPAAPAIVPSAASQPLVFPAIEPNRQAEQSPPDDGSLSQMPSVGLSSNTEPSTTTEPGTPAAKIVDVSNQKPPEQTVVQTPAPSAVLAQPQPSTGKNARPIIRSGPRFAIKPPAKKVPKKKKNLPTVSRRKA